MIKPQVATYRCFQLFYTRDMIPYPIKEGAFCLAYIETATLAVHHIDNAWSLTSYSVRNFFELTIWQLHLMAFLYV